MLARNASRIQYPLVTSFLCGNSLSVRRSLATRKSAETNGSSATDRALVDISKHIIYEDTQLLVVSKPPGVLSQGDLSQEDNVVDAVRRYLGSAPQFPRPATEKPLPSAYVHLLHRLDRPASGVLCLAKTQLAARHMTNAFKSRRIAKHYLCVVNGEMRNAMDLQHELLMKSDKGVKVVTESFLEKNPHLRKSVLRSRLACRPLYTMQHETIGPQTLVHVTLETGRKHQIRAQLAHTGFAIIGDVRYGAPARLKSKEIALHAHSLEFEHPTTKEVVRLKAPVPESWQRLFNEKLVEVANAFTAPNKLKGHSS